MPKPSFSSSCQQAGFFQVQLATVLEPGANEVLTHGLRTRPSALALLRQQAGGDHVARVAGVGAAGDGGNDHRAIGHQALGFFALARSSLAASAMPRCGQVAGGQAAVRVAGAGHVAHHAGQVEAQHALVLGGFQRDRPTGRCLGVLLDQCHLRRLRGRSVSGSRWFARRCRTSPPWRRIPGPCWRWWRGRQWTGCRRPRRRTPA